MPPSGLLTDERIEMAGRGKFSSVLQIFMLAFSVESSVQGNCIVQIMKNDLMILIAYYCDRNVITVN